MKKLIIILLILVPAFLQAQVNLVRNGSFEHYSSCPTGIDQVRRAIFWNTIDTISVASYCTPEYCNACADASTSGVGVPNGWIYTHFPRTGNGMMESLLYYDSLDVGALSPLNYVQGKLFSRLVSGTNYCVTFYVTLCQQSQYAIDHIGAYLDDGRIDAGQDSVGCGKPQTGFSPQVFTTTIINDTLNWVKIQGSFIANGTEKFVTVGNFFNNSNTDTLKRHPTSLPNVSFYLIDDVSVIESNAIANAGSDKTAGAGDTVLIGTTEEGMPCTWYALGDTTPIGYSGGIKVHHSATGTYKYVVKLDLCGHVTYDTMTLYVWPVGIVNAQLSIADVQCYPNPASNELTIEDATGYDVTFYDLVGREMVQLPITFDKQVININKLTKGIYIVQIIAPTTGAKIIKKIIKE